MKKVTLTVLSAVFMLCIIFAVPQTANAAGKTITANKSYVISLGNQTKYFTFVVPETCYFYYTVTPLKYIENGIESDSTSWYLPSTRMKVNYKLYEESSVHYGNPFRSASYSYQKGTRISISLKDENSSNSWAYYRLKVVTKKVQNFEKESNYTRSRATKMICNKVYTGLSQQDDKDWWCFTAPKTGRYKISCVEINDNKIQTVKAYLGYRLVSTGTMESNKGWASLYKGKLKKGQKIYILLDDGSKNEFYRLKVKKIS